MLIEPTSTGVIDHVTVVLAVLVTVAVSCAFGRFSVLWLPDSRSLQLEAQHRLG